ncbi:MAG: hypothetical protein ACP59X_07925 [Solidesulfovibrio sp. DCME]|uniref:hypothetical protein n=1 Tax=Solidesulfovibrio sp. DCME TaxID=3447380 RepID=UPI003D12FBE6
MFAPSIQLESISFFEPSEGVWREEAVKAPAGEDRGNGPNLDDEEFEAFCRRSLL